MLELGKLIDTTNFYIAFYNEEKQTISIPFITGEDAEENFPVGKSMTGYLIKKNAPLLIKSNEYKQLIASGEIQLIGTFPKAWLGVPLAENNKVIGAIVVQSYNDKNAFKQDDIELLEFISSQIGFMLQRRKVSQENLISKEVLRKVLDNIPTKVFWKDKNSKFLGLNATSLKELNVDHESMVIGKTDFDLHHIKDAEKYRADELAVMKSGEPKLNYIESQIRNGKEHSYISSKLPFFDANNKVIGIIGTSEDITERIENEDKLKKADDLCRHFLKISPHHIEAMKMLATICTKLHVYEDSEFLLESCLVFEPDNIDLSIEYINLLIKRQKYSSKYYY